MKKACCSIYHCNISIARLKHKGSTCITGSVQSFLTSFYGLWFCVYVSQSGVTALTYAALNGHLEAVQTLFNHGALAGIRDISGYLPLHYACKGGYELVVREFVSRAEGLTVSTA